MSAADIRDMKSSQKARLERLEKEVEELRCANEILRTLAAYLASRDTELSTRRGPQRLTP